MGAMKARFEDTVYRACDLMFEWDECGCRWLSEMYDPDYADAMNEHRPYNTPASLATELMIADAILGADVDDKANLLGVAHSAMRNMLEYASDEPPSSMCYGTATMLDQFDALVSFCNMVG